MVKVNDKIRSYDFPSSRDYYMEGVVYHEKGGLLSVKTTKHVVDGKERPLDHGTKMFKVPDVGYAMFDDNEKFPARIVVL